MEILGNLGIDIKLLIAQIINFGLLLWLLTKFLYKPIIKRIEKDEMELKQAQTQKKELEQKKNEYIAQKNKEMAETKKQVREIIQEAEKIAQEIKKRTSQEATQEKQAVIKQIKSRLSEIEYAKKHKQQKIMNPDEFLPFFQESLGFKDYPIYFYMRCF